MKNFLGLLLILGLLISIEAAPPTGFQSKADAEATKRTLKNMIARVMKRDFANMVSRVMKREPENEVDEPVAVPEDYNAYLEGKRSLKNMIARVMKRGYSNMVARVMKRLPADYAEEPDYIDYFNPRF